MLKLHAACFSGSLWKISANNSASASHRRHNLKAPICKLVISKEKLADEPVSRILCAAPRALTCVSGDWRSRRPCFRRARLNRRSAMIIPLGPESLRDSSSLPEGFSTCVQRAGPALPSYLALLHAGFSVPRVLPPGRWALTPPFHPYRCARPKWRVHGFSVNLPQRL